MIVEENGKWYIIYKETKQRCATKAIAEKELKRYVSQENKYQLKLKRNKGELPASNTSKL